MLLFQQSLSLPHITSVQFGHKGSLELIRPRCSPSELRKRLPKCTEAVRAVQVGAEYRYVHSTQLVLRLNGSTPLPHSSYRLIAELIVHGGLWRTSSHQLCTSLQASPSDELRECSRRDGAFAAAINLYVPGPLPRSGTPSAQEQGELQRLDDYAVRMRQLAAAAKSLGEINVCSLGAAVLSPTVTKRACRRHGRQQDESARVGVHELMISLKNSELVATNLFNEDWLPIAAAFVTAALSLPQPFTIVEVGNYCVGATLMLSLLKRIYCPRCPFVSLDPGTLRTIDRKGAILTQCHREVLAWAGVAEEVTLIDDFSGTVNVEMPVGFAFFDGGKYRVANDPTLTALADRMMIGAVLALDDAWQAEVNSPAAQNHYGQTMFALELIDGDFEPLIIPPMDTKRKHAIKPPMSGQIPAALVEKVRAAHQRTPPIDAAVVKRFSEDLAPLQSDRLNDKIAVVIKARSRYGDLKLTAGPVTVRLTVSDGELSTSAPAYASLPARALAEPIHVVQQRIPLLGTAVNKDPELQLLRLFASLDAPVDNLVIVHGQADPIVDMEVEYILNNVDSATRVTVLRYPGYLGCAEAWNAVFTAVPDAPWGIFAASDTAFTDGALGILARQFWPLAQPGVAIAAGVTWTNPGMPSGGWGTWALSRGAIERCGLFDENIWPAFFEDREMFNLRRSACDMRTVVFDDVRMVHGRKGEPPSSGVKKLQTDPVFSAILARAKPASHSYIIAKWGCDPNDRRKKACRSTTLQHPLRLGPALPAPLSAAPFDWALDVGTRTGLLQEVAKTTKNSLLVSTMQELERRDHGVGQTLGPQMACTTSWPGTAALTALIDAPFNLSAAAIRRTHCMVREDRLSQVKVNSSRKRYGGVTTSYRRAKGSGTHTCSTDLKIPSWTGTPAPVGGMAADQLKVQIVGLGNDLMQLAEGLLQAEETPRVCGVTFSGADVKRGGGMSLMIPSLRSGRIAVRPGKATVMRFSHYGRRYREAKRSDKIVSLQNSSEYRRVLRHYLGKELLAHYAYRGPSLSDTLVVHLRGGDAVRRLGLWFNDWASPQSMINYVSACVRASGLPHVRVVTQVFDGPQAHPALQEIRRLAKATGSFDVTGSRQTLDEDFALLMHAKHVCLDFSTLGLAAALISYDLEQVYLPLLKNRSRTPKQRGGYPMQRGLGIGFTLPSARGLKVHHIDERGISSRV